MSNEDPDETDVAVSDAERDLLIEQYNNLASERTTLIQVQSRRIAVMMTALGALLGYGLISTQLWIISFTPFVLGAFFLRAVKTVGRLATVAHHRLIIEQRLANNAELFGHEYRYGIYYDPNDGGARQRFRLTHVPSLAGLSFAIALYLFMVVLSISVWPTAPERVAVIDSSLLGLSYFFFSAFLVAVGWIGFVNIDDIGTPRDRP